MKLVPKYSYEFNIVLNKGLNDDEQLRNFASLISDKDRFLAYLPMLEKNAGLIEDRLGYKLPQERDFYIVRSELMKSFSEPITVEYSILPEEMIVFLLKEIVKTTIEDRFLDEISQEQYINSFTEYIFINGDFGKTDFVKFGKNLHDESLRLYERYEFIDIDFSKKTMKEHLEKIYEERM